MKRFVNMALMIGVVMLLIAGCSSNKENGTASDSPPASSSSASASTAEPSGSSSEAHPGRPAEFKKIKMLSLGDESARMKEFLADINVKLKEEINTELEIQYVPWSAYGSGQQIDLMLASGQDFDFTFTDPTWLNQLVQKKVAYDLTDLVEPYMADLKKNLTPEHFEQFTIGGKLYAIPMGYSPLSANSYSISVRKDLMDEVGVKSISTIDELYNFATLVKAKHPDMYATPNTPSFVQPYIRGLSDQNYTWDEVSKYFLTDENSAEGNLVSFVDSPEFKAQADFFRKMYENNLISKDILTNKAATKDLFTSGKYMWMQGRSGGNNLIEVLPQLKENVPNAELYEVMFAPEKPKIKTGYASTAVMVPAYSKNADRVAMLLNLMQKDRENFLFFVYGIQDKDYKIVNDKVEKINKDELMFQWALFNVNYPVYESTLPDDFIAINKSWDEGAVASKMFGFSLVLEPVKVQKVKLDAVFDERIKPILAGVISYDKGFKKAKAEMEAAGWNEYFAEVQKQYKAFRATKQ
ncbi:extracellular solute-binding protein [Cohnella soli]|uniref:Extracellular solute-binding protein n=1 Tax=Cohnella soli TaxID=425005 RepID=A0ABW0HS80_9BACL